MLDRCECPSLQFWFELAGGLVLQISDRLRWSGFFASGPDRPWDWLGCGHLLMIPHRAHLWTLLGPSQLSGPFFLAPVVRVRSTLGSLLNSTTAMPASAGAWFPGSFSIRLSMLRAGVHRSVWDFAVMGVASVVCKSGCVVSNLEFLPSPRESASIVPGGLSWQSTIPANGAEHLDIRLAIEVDHPQRPFPVPS